MKATIRFGLSAIFTLMLTVPLLAGQPGTLKWAFPTGGKVSSSPALGRDGTVYVGSEDGKVYAINFDGTKKWEFPTGGPVSSAPVINDQGIIHIISKISESDNSRLYALNLDGTCKWFFEFLGSGVGCALGRDQTIYLSVFESIRNCFLYAIDPAGKATLLQTMEEINGGPAIGPDGAVYLSGWESWKVRIFAFNPAGARKWDFRMGINKVYPPVAIARDGTIYFASNRMGPEHYAPDLCAIASSGFLKWAFNIEGEGEYSPVIDVHGNIYVNVNTHMLYVIDPNGSLKWSKPCGGPLALGADGAVYTSIGGKTAAFNENGTERWVSNINDWVDSCPPTLASDGTLYFSGYQSYPSFETKLYAIYSDSPGLAKSAWPMYQHDPQHTGRAQPPDINPSIMLLRD